MSHPICGKCHSTSVYKDYDADDQPAIACFICGNIYPGGREGFYMSDKPVSQIRKESVGIMEDKQEDAKQVKFCSVCHVKPTIPDSSNNIPFLHGKEGK